MADTGFPDADAQADFSRARRRARLNRAVSRLRRQHDDVTQVLPYDEVVAALGETGRRELGLIDVPVEAIVGSVDRTGQFDRDFRPTTSISRERWARINAAQRRGETVPPVRLRKVGGMYFVVDGHHRVSVARHRAIRTSTPTSRRSSRASTPTASAHRDLVLKDHRHLLSRVPLPAERAARIVPTPGSTRARGKREAWASHHAGRARVPPPRGLATAGSHRVHPSSPPPAPGLAPTTPTRLFVLDRANATASSAATNGRTTSSSGTRTRPKPSDPGRRREGRCFTTAARTRPAGLGDQLRVTAQVSPVSAPKR